MKFLKFLQVRRCQQVAKGYRGLRRKLDPRGRRLRLRPRRSFVDAPQVEPPPQYQQEDVALPWQRRTAIARKPAKAPSILKKSK
jgi:hypothetical protein